MGYLSSFLKSKGHQVEVIDGLNTGLSNEDIVQCCIDFKADLVGVYCLSSFFLDVKKMTELLKQKGIRVMIGGAQATFMPKFTMEQTGADFIILGEGELTASLLVDCIEKDGDIKQIPGVVSKDNLDPLPGKVIENLDDLPFPDWDSIDPRIYKKAPHGGFIKYFPYAPMTTTRGCPYRCTFCASPKFSSRTLRRRSPKNVVDEIEYLVKKFRIKEIHFEDDNFTFYREHAKGVCDLILERGIKVAWACPNGVRADKVDLELLKLMKRSGCYYLAFGIESGNQDILNNVKKDITLEKIKRGVELADEAGIMTQGFFVFGLPGETEDTIDNTIEFAKSIPLTRAQFLHLDVMPGTELWETLNFQEKVDWTKNSYHEVTWVPDTVKGDVLAKAAPRAFRSFYFRPKQMYNILKYVRPSQIKFLLLRLKDCGIFS